MTRSRFGRKWRAGKSADYSLNTNEVFDIIGAPCNCVLFEDICKLDSLSDLFPSSSVGPDLVSRCLINYLYSSNYGHWVGLCIRLSSKKDGKPII